MPLTLRRGTVTQVLERHDELVRLQVDGVACIAYPRLTGPIDVGDDVVVNVQARELGLGSGGFDVLHANLTRGLDLPAADAAHVMTLPYTPVQSAVRHAEEADPLADALAGRPVVCCSLHSQLAPVCGALGRDLRVAYVQVPGGALQVSLSDTVRALKRERLLDVAVAAGPCLDGDVQCVGIPSALAWAAAAGYDAIVCAVGPGLVGTASPLGHGGVTAAAAANASSALGGAPILAVRASEHDPRERHRGVSHHTRAAAALCLGEFTVAWPAAVDAPAWLEPREEVDVDGWRAACRELPLEHMGRSPDEDPLFFAVAFAAGRLARTRVGAG